MSGQDLNDALSKARADVAKLQELADEYYVVLKDSYKSLPSGVNETPTVEEVYQTFIGSAEADEQARMYALLTNLNIWLQKEPINVDKLYSALCSFLSSNRKYLLDITGLSEHSKEAKEINDTVRNIAKFLKDKLTAEYPSFKNTHYDLNKLDKSFQQWNSENPAASMLFSTPRPDSGASTEFTVEKVYPKPEPYTGNHATSPKKRPGKSSG